MTTEPLSDDELERLRDGALGPEPPCGGCGTPPQLMSDGMHHYFHEEGCEVMARIREMQDGGEE
jgi:hypothetical protein